MIPRCEEIEIRATNYDNVILQCSLPCDWSGSPNGPVHISCHLWDAEKKECGKKGIWYCVLINDCAMIWEGNDEKTARALCVVLKDIAERNEIPYKSCFKK